MKSGTPYRRLPGSAGLIVSKRLWLGQDHVLLVSSNVLSQEYRRFYFNDIEAIVLAEIESAARFYGFVLSIMAGVFTVGLAASGYTFWAVFCVIVCGGLIVFTRTRPLVRCSLKTRIGTQPLASLKHVNTARRVTAILKVEIERVQGMLPAASLSSHPHVDAAAIPPPLETYKGRMHYATFAAMFVVVALTLFRLNVQSQALANTLAGTHIAMILFAVIAAVKQHGNRIASMARTAVVLALAWATASYIAEQVIVATTVQAAYRMPMSFEYWRDPVRDVAIANSVAYTALGLVGLFALLTHKPARVA
jgi:hypothetical protein